MVCRGFRNTDCPFVQADGKKSSKGSGLALGDSWTAHCEEIFRALKAGFCSCAEVYRLLTSVYPRVRCKS